jgi:hypothetical protein
MSVELMNSEQGSSELDNPDPGIGSGQESGTDNPGVSGQFQDIDSLEKYRYQGRPLKEWESGYMRQQDYTQKTQSLAQERRFVDNLSADLDRVRDNPSLAEQFRGIYPEKFHAYLRYVLQNSQSTPQRTGNEVGQTGRQTEGQNARLDPAQERRIAQLESVIRDQAVSTIQAELDQKFKGLSQKYPFADEEAVIARAQALLGKMQEQDPMNQNLKISDKQWDALWKSQHERAHQLSEAQYQQKVKAQLATNKKASDTGGGGGIPGQAPRKFKTIKEASEQALKDIEAGTY